MARASAAVVIFALVCCLLVDPYPARRPGELPPQVITAAHVPVDDPREASAEPLLPKLVALEEVDPVRQAPQVFRCGGEDVAAAVTVSSSSEEDAQPRRESGAEEEAGIMGWFRGSDTDCDSGSDTDCDSGTDRDSDSDDEHDGGGIMGWFWRLARRF